MSRLLPSDRRLRWLAVAGYALITCVLVALLVLAALPIALFRSAVEQRLSARFGRPVTIATLDRRERFSLTPTILVGGVRVPQAPWAGPGDLATIRRAAIRLPLLPLFLGRVEPRAIDVSGARVVLVRAADGRENWRRSGSGGGHQPALDHLTVTDTVITYRDAKQNRAVTLSLAADPARGLHASGRGSIAGHPVNVTLHAGAITDGRARWPFRAVVQGPALALDARGTAAAPLDLNHLAFDVTARADDLKLLDAVIEAGLFGTQPVRLAAHVTHDEARWRIAGLAGTIGRSHVVGHLDVDKDDGRTKLDGAVRFATLDFDDLASDAGLARAAALERRDGPKLVPGTRVNLRKITRTDGRIAFRADRIVSRKGESSLTTMSGRLVLDDQRLTVDPLRVGLRQGAIQGRATVDQRGGPPLPTVTLDLRLTDSTIGALVDSGGEVTGRLDGRALLVGRGSTIREAVGRSTGRLGLVARDGALPKRMAAALGFDAGRTLLTGKDARASLRCAGVGGRVAGGVLTASTLVVDTSQSRLDGSGTVRFPAEALALRLTGAPKRGSLLRVPGSALATGTIRAPAVTLPPRMKSAGTILKAVGRAIIGHQGPTATDADCPALAARLLR